jgi:hypothetical protein
MVNSFRTVASYNPANRDALAVYDGPVIELFFDSEQDLKIWVDRTHAILFANGNPKNQRVGAYAPSNIVRGQDYYLLLGLIISPVINPTPAQVVSANPLGATVGRTTTKEDRIQDAADRNDAALVKETVNETWKKIEQAKAANGS